MKPYSLAAPLSVTLFGIGLAMSGTTDPRRVLGFLDIFGAFDPTLAFVPGGAALFGIGWGIAGLRPGPALGGLGVGSIEALWFVPAMLAGMLLHRLANLA